VATTFSALSSRLNQKIVGQSRLIERLLMALLADGHLLVEEFALVLALVLGAIHCDIRLAQQGLAMGIWAHAKRDTQTRFA